MAADRDAARPASSLIFRFWNLPSPQNCAGAEIAQRRCAACSGAAICLRCGGRGRVLIVPMGWQLRPHVEQCPECRGTAACPECGDASMN